MKCKKGPIISEKSAKEKKALLQEHSDNGNDEVSITFGRKRNIPGASPEDFILMKLSITGSTDHLLQVDKVSRRYEEQVEVD